MNAELTLSNMEKSSQCPLGASSQQGWRRKAIPNITQLQISQHTTAELSNSIKIIGGSRCCMLYFRSASRGGTHA